MDNNAINKQCRYTHSQYWDEILELIEGSLPLLDNSIEEFVEAVIPNFIVGGPASLYNVDSVGLCYSEGDTLTTLKDWKEFFDNSTSISDEVRAAGWENFIAHEVNNNDIEVFGINMNHEGQHLKELFLDIFEILSLRECLDAIKELDVFF